MIRKESIRSKIHRAEILFLYLFAAFSFVSIAGTQIALGVAFILWIIRHLTQKSFLGQKTGLEWLIIAVFAWALLGTFISPRPMESFVHLKHLLLIIVVFLLADRTLGIFVNPDRVSNPVRVRFAEKFLYIWISTATLLSLVGIIRYLSQDTLKVMATQSTTMTWAAMLAPVTTITVAILLFLPTSRKEKWLWGAAAAIQIIALFYSFVRGAYLGLIAGVGVILLVRKPKLILGFAVAAAMVLFLAPENLQARFLSIFDLSSPTTQVRLVQWQHALEMIRESPIFGFGWIDLGALHRQMIPPDPSLLPEVLHDVFYIGHFHSNPVMWMMIWGVPGLLLMLVFFGKIFILQWQALETVDENIFASVLALGCFGALTGFLITGLFDWTFGDAETVTILWITVGLALRNIPASTARGDSKIGG
ncbi:MAG: O-antigen ligase family protein [bacterium]